MVARSRIFTQMAMLRAQVTGKISKYFPSVSKERVFTEALLRKGKWILILIQVLAFLKIRCTSVAILTKKFKSRVLK